MGSEVFFLVIFSEVIDILPSPDSIDDIEDNSVLRRGIPVAHSIYGVASTINSANYVYFLGLERVLALDHPEVISLFPTAELLVLLMMWLKLMKTLFYCLTFFPDTVW